MVYGGRKWLWEKHEIYILLAYTIFLALSYSGFSNLLPAILKTKGVTLEVIGATYTIEKFAVLIISLEMLLYSAGRRAYLIAPIILICYALLLIVFTMVKDPLVLAILVPIITGIYMSLRPINRALVNTLTSRGRLGTIVGILSTLTFLVSAISTGLYGFLLAFLGLNTSIAILILFISPALIFQIMLIRIVISLYSSPRQEEIKLMLSRTTLKIVTSEKLYILLACSTFFESGVPVFISIFLWEILGGPFLTGMILAMNYILYSIMAVTIGALSDKIGKPLLFISISLITISLSYILLGLSELFSTFKLILVILSIVFSSISPSLFTPNLQKYVALKREDSLVHFALIEILDSIAAIPGPLVASMLIQRFSYHGYFLLIAVAVFVIGYIILTYYTLEQSKIKKDC